MSEFKTVELDSFTLDMLHSGHPVIQCGLSFLTYDEPVSIVKILVSPFDVTAKALLSVTELMHVSEHPIVIPRVRINGDTPHDEPGVDNFLRGKSALSISLGNF